MFLTFPSQEMAVCGVSAICAAVLECTRKGNPCSDSILCGGEDSPAIPQPGRSRICWVSRCCRLLDALKYLHGIVCMHTRVPQKADMPHDIKRFWLHRRLPHVLHYLCLCMCPLTIAHHSPPCSICTVVQLSVLMPFSRQGHVYKIKVFNSIQFPLYSCNCSRLTNIVSQIS